MSTKPSSLAYASAGVNLRTGDAISQYAADLCRRSYNNSRYVRVHDFAQGNFRGPRGFELENLPVGVVMTAGADGNGTKTIISSAAGLHFESAHDLIAMTGGDITRWGGMPLVFLNILDASTLGRDTESEIFKNFKELFEGLSLVAERNGIVLLSGETAELSQCVSSEITSPNYMKYNWGGVMIGVYHRDKIINGSTLAPGQKVIALRDKLRANGGSLIRKMLREKFGSEWWNNPEAHPDILDAASPSIIYDRFFTTANGWLAKRFQPVFTTHFIAHLSGGGIHEKFAKLLFDQNLSAKLDDLFEPPDCVKNAVEHFKLTNTDAYETFNGGQGALFVVNEGDTSKALSLADNFDLEAKVAGTIVKQKGGRPYVQITSRFDGAKFSYSTP